MCIRDRIRGVKCDHAINKLVEYSLVRELGRLDAPGRPILLGTTEEFLRCFGVQDLESLPVPDPVQIEDFKAEEMCIRDSYIAALYKWTGKV